MRRFDPELLSGVAMLAVLLIATAPVLFWGAPISIPYGAWVGAAVLMLVSLFGSTWETAGDRRGVQRALFAVAVVLCWLLVLTGGGQGLLPILVVVTAAVSPYVVPIWAGFVVIALNQVVVVWAFAASRQASEGFLEVVAGGTFYLLIQVASLLSSVALLREQRLRRELAEAHVELQGAAALLSESARTSERLRISRELHDLIGHQLTVLTLELEAAKHRNRDDAVRDHIVRADSVARELLRSVRTTVDELRHEPRDLAEILNEMVQDLPEPRVTLDVDPELTLDEAQVMLLVRAVQEILTNTIRHARAKELSIRIAADVDGVVVVSQDDGRGTPHVVPGNGLRGLSERFEQHGGGVTFSSGRDAGFRVEARVPLHEPREVGA